MLYSLNTTSTLANKIAFKNKNKVFLVNNLKFNDFEAVNNKINLELSPNELNLVECISWFCALFKGEFDTESIIEWMK